MRVPPYGTIIWILDGDAAPNSGRPPTKSSRREYGASVALDDKFDGLQRLVQMGKEKGYVLYDEVSEVLPGDINGGTELDDVLAGLDLSLIHI